jgi:hypothetical protein
VLLDILIGGACTLAGGFGSAWLIVWLERRGDEKRLKDEVLAAVNVTIQELHRNATWLEGKLDAPGGASPIRLSDSSYRAVQLLLARGLEVDVVARLGYVYNEVPQAEAIVQRGIDRAGLGGLTNQDVEQLRAILKDGTSLRDELISYYNARRKPRNAEG